VANPSDERRRAVWAALCKSVEDDPPIDFSENLEWEYGFLLARRVQGILLEYGYVPAKVKLSSLRDFVNQFADDHGLDGDDLIEKFCDAWGKIRVPEGVDPIAAAAAKVSGKPIEGDWPTDGFARDAAKVYGIALELAGGVGGRCFLPCRKVAAAIDGDAMRVSRLLTALVVNGYLVKIGAATKQYAQRFEVVK